MAKPVELESPLDPAQEIRKSYEERHIVGVDLEYLLQGFEPGAGTYISLSNLPSRGIEYEFDSFRWVGISQS